MKNNNIKNAFTLIEIILVIAIMSIVLLGSVALVMPKKIKKKQAFIRPHGSIECYWDGDQLMQFTIDNDENENGTVIPVEGDHCTFTPPRADFFTLQVVGAGQDGVNNPQAFTIERDVIEQIDERVLDWETSADNPNPQNLVQAIQSLGFDSWVMEYWNNQWVPDVKGGGYIYVKSYPQLGKAGSAECRVALKDGFNSEQYPECSIVSFPITKEFINRCGAERLEVIAANGAHSGRVHSVYIKDLKVFFGEAPSNGIDYTFIGQVETSGNDSTFLIAKGTGTKADRKVAGKGTRERGEDGYFDEDGLRHSRYIQAEDKKYGKPDYRFLGISPTVSSSSIPTPNVATSASKKHYFKFLGGSCDLDINNFNPSVEGQPYLNDDGSWNVIKNRTAFGEDYEHALNYFLGKTTATANIRADQVQFEIRGHYGKSGSPGNYMTITSPELPPNELRLYPQKTRINKNNEETTCSRIDEVVSENSVRTKLQCTNLALEQNVNTATTINPINADFGRGIDSSVIHKYIEDEHREDVVAHSFYNNLSYYSNNSRAIATEPGQSGFGWYNIYSNINEEHTYRIGPNQNDMREVHRETYTNSDEDIMNTYTCLNGDEPSVHNSGQLYCSSTEGKPGAVVIIW